MDFSDYPKINSFYSGSEKKIGIRIDNVEWILKFQYKDELGFRFNHISEHLGSTIFNMIGIEAQQTELGTYKGEEVVACKNFIPAGFKFVPFNDVGESTLETDKDRFQYSYEDIETMLAINRKITDLDTTTERFWDIYIVDALLGNFDRHGGNWGFLKNEDGYYNAPVFDNGSCLFPQMTDEDTMRKIIDSKELTEERVFKFPTSQIKLDGRKSSYHDVISSLRFPECNDALIRICPRIDLDNIHELIDRIESISEIHKEFYMHMISCRYNMILLESFERLMG